MRPLMIASSLALVLGFGNSALSQVFLAQPAWNPVPIVIVPTGVPVPTIPAQNSEPSTSAKVSHYGVPEIASTPAPFLMATITPVRVERYYFMPSEMDPILPPQNNSTSVPRVAVASPHGEVIIREYFVMDRPVSENGRKDTIRESTSTTTPQNSSQEKPSDQDSKKLDKPKWSEEFDKSDKVPATDSTAPKSNETPVPGKESKQEQTPPAEKESKDQPTDPIAPAEPPVTTPNSST
ncbi:hypothetical protein K2Y11_04540 [bacterium]|nr:hypothetical protein [bacterium]